MFILLSPRSDVVANASFESERKDADLPIVSNMLGFVNASLTLFVIPIKSPQVVTLLCAGAGHFCRLLTITGKLGLCHQPGGLLCVQSLHLPLRLGSALSALYVNFTMNDTVLQLIHNFRTLLHHKST